MSQGIKPHSTARLTYIDALRGFAIFLVTLGHVLENSGYHDSELYMLIYSFHMPLFFCISGFLCAYVNQNKFDEHDGYIQSCNDGIRFIWKKFRFIMIPYFVWSLIVLPFFFNTYSEPLQWMSYFKNTCIDNTSFWFLPCLFGLFLYYPVYRIVILGRKSLILKFVVIILGYLIAFGLLEITHSDFLRSISSYYIPFWFGVAIGEYKTFEKIVTESNLIFLISLVLFCLIEGLYISHTGIVGKGVKLLCGILSIPILLNFFKHINIPEKIEKTICYIGVNTLPIYVMQFSFIKGLYVINGLNLFYQAFIFSIVSLILIGFILAITAFLNRSGIIRQVLLGKR